MSATTQCRISQRWVVQGFETAWWPSAEVSWPVSSSCTSGSWRQRNWQRDSWKAKRNTALYQLWQWYLVWFDFIAFVTNYSRSAPIYLPHHISFCGVTLQQLLKGVSWRVVVGIIYVCEISVTHFSSCYNRTRITNTLRDVWYTFLRATRA